MAMTEQDLKNFIENPPDCGIGLRVDKRGEFLTTGDGAEHPITERQAEVLWEVLPLVARLQAAKRAARVS